MFIFCWVIQTCALIIIIFTAKILMFGDIQYLMCDASSRGQAVNVFCSSDDKNVWVRNTDFAELPQTSLNLFEWPEVKWEVSTVVSGIRKVSMTKKIHRLFLSEQMWTGRSWNLNLWIKSAALLKHWAVFAPVSEEGHPVRRCFIPWGLGFTLDY